MANVNGRRYHGDKTRLYQSQYHKFAIYRKYLLTYLHTRIELFDVKCTMTETHV